MSKRSPLVKPELVLDDDILDAIGENIVADRIDAGRIASLRARVLGQVDNDDAPPRPFETIRGAEGSWIEVLPRVEKKVLNVNRDGGTESYLLRIHAGGSIPRHEHDSDELCYVIDGDVRFGDLHIQAGDYHFARKGSVHEKASSVHGALLLIQSGIASEHHGA